MSVLVLSSGEFFLNRSRECSIALVVNVVETWLAEHNMPRNIWNRFVEHFTLIRAVTRVCLISKKIAVYEVELQTTMTPHLDQMTPVIFYTLHFYMNAKFALLRRLAFT